MALAAQIIPWKYPSSRQIWRSKDPTPASTFAVPRRSTTKSVRNKKHQELYPEPFLLGWRQDSKTPVSKCDGLVTGSRIIVRATPSELDTDALMMKVLIYNQVFVARGALNKLQRIYITPQSFHDVQHSARKSFIHPTLSHP